MSRQARTFFSDLSKIMFARQHCINEIFSNYSRKKLNQIVAYQNKQYECQFVILAKTKVWDGEREKDEYTAEHISARNNGSNLITHNFIAVRHERLPYSCPPLPIYCITHFRVGTKKLIALGDGRFERTNEYKIVLCDYEHDTIQIVTYLKNKHCANISDMTYYYNDKNETVLISACENQTIILWNINTRDCSNGFQGEPFAWGKITSIDTYFDNYNNSRRIIFGSQDQNISILHVGTNEYTIIKTMAVGHKIGRLSQNNDILVKVIKRMNQNFLAATNNHNEIKFRICQTLYLLKMKNV